MNSARHPDDAPTRNNRNEPGFDLEAVHAMRERLRHLADSLTRIAPEVADEAILLWTDPSTSDLMTMPRRDRIMIGRADSNDVILDTPEVSRHHCSLQQEDDGMVIRDSGSRNGTWLNGRPINQPTPLLPGDVLTLGKCTVFYTGVWNPQE